MLKEQGCGLPGIDIVVATLVGKASNKLVKKLWLDNKLVMAHQSGTISSSWFCIKSCGGWPIEVRGWPS